MQRFFRVGWILIVVGCGGSVVTVGPADGGINKTPNVSDGGATVGFSDASGSDALTCGLAPTNHRASGSPCPQARGAGRTTQGIPPTSSCSSDADCTAGKNGRCLPAGFSVSYECSYDTCFMDTDCPMNQPCDCRTSAADNAPNECRPGSSCRIDSDCGPCGYCSQSLNAQYFCHTGGDTCVNDSDCTNDRNSCGTFCSHDPATEHWSCAVQCLP